MPFLAALLLAQTAPAQCAAIDASLPAAYAAWKTPGESFEPGKAVELQATGGTTTIGFRIGKAGVYGIALDQKGWIDVTPGAAGGEPLKPVSHREGDSCWSIRKIVRFQLDPGLYRLTLGKLAGPKARVMLIAGE